LIARGLHQTFAAGIILLACSATTAHPQTSVRSQPTFRFSREAGAVLKELWQTSVAAKEERAACLASTISHDTVFVSRARALPPEEADSMGLSATASVEQCGPPVWSGTVHTHIALYADDSPSTRFSAQDRTAMRMWYDRWHADGVFCLLYSKENAHCEADGVVGGLRSRPRFGH
jgi:hypothetical protein